MLLTHLCMVHGALRTVNATQEGDVRALSDINRSTKKKKRGYIGKKGIGFKSVFKVGRRGQACAVVALLCRSHLFTSSTVR